MRQERDIPLLSALEKISSVPKPLVIAIDRPKRALTSSEEQLVSLWNNAPQVLCHTNEKEQPEQDELNLYKKADLGGSSLVVIGWASFLISLSNMTLSSDTIHWSSPLWAVPVLVLGFVMKSFAQKKQQGWKMRHQEFLSSTPPKSMQKERISRDLEELMQHSSFEDAPVSYQQIVHNLHKSCLDNTLPIGYWSQVENILASIKKKHQKNS